MLDRPYFRIARPVVSAYGGSYVSGLSEKTYLCSNKYASDRIQQIRAYHVLEHDLIKIFEYVEPCDDNSATYSFRLYEILLRAATEFESNCKLILVANSYDKSSSLNITDYYKLESAMRLSEYELRLPNWGPRSLIVAPMKAWSSSHTLAWYKAYNSVKHNRSEQFQEACLLRAVEALGAVLCLLYAQFAFLAFSENEEVAILSRDSDGFEGHGDSLFTLKHPTSWTDDEKYNFTDEDFSHRENVMSDYQFA